MSFLKENQQGISQSLSWVRTLGVALAIFLFLGSAAYSPAQLPKSPAPATAKTDSTPTVDPLGRETPHSAMMGFLKYEQREDYRTAARYLQSTPGQDTDLTQRAKELQALHGKFKGNIALLSDDPNGTVESGLPPGQVRAGVLVVGGTTIDVILVRVGDPASGKIWLISQETVGKIPELYAQMKSEGPTAVDRIVPAALTGRHLLGMSLAQWLGWLLSIPISWGLMLVLTFLLSAPRQVWYKLRKLPFRTLWDTTLGAPLKCIIAVLMHGFFVYLLAPPLLYRAFYFRFLTALLAGCMAWLVSRIFDRGLPMLSTGHGPNAGAGSRS